MTDDELDRMVVAARRVDDTVVAGLASSASQQALLEEIMATPTLTTDTGTGSPGSPRRGRGRLLVIAAAAAVAAGLALVWLPGVGDNDAFAASDVAVAEANPRLLLDVPGWTIDHVDTFTVTEGEMRFTNGDSDLEVHWRAADTYQSYLDDRAADGNERSELTVLGETAAVFQYGDSTDFTALLPPNESNFVEIRADVGSRAGYEELVAALHPVDVDTWLSAMPDSVVQPRDRRDAVTEMLVGIPVPDGFDPVPLQDSDGASDDYQVGADVSGAVACSWYSQWVAATESGDAASAQEAVDALLTSRTWPVLLAMNAEGDYPEAVWEIADRVAAGTAERTDFSAGLGCDAPPRSSYLD